MGLSNDEIKYQQNIVRSRSVGSSNFLAGYSRTTSNKSGGRDKRNGGRTLKALRIRLRAC